MGSRCHWRGGGLLLLIILLGSIASTRPLYWMFPSTHLPGLVPHQLFWLSILLMVTVLLAITPSPPAM